MIWLFKLLINQTHHVISFYKINLLNKSKAITILVFSFDTVSFAVIWNEEENIRISSKLSTKKAAVVPKAYITL